MEARAFESRCDLRTELNILGPHRGAEGVMARFSQPPSATFSRFPLAQVGQFRRGAPAMQVQTLPLQCLLANWFCRP